MKFSCLSSKCRVDTSKTRYVEYDIPVSEVSLMYTSNGRPIFKCTCPNCGRTLNKFTSDEKAQKFKNGVDF